jgi:hypothetical protein
MARNCLPLRRPRVNKLYRLVQADHTYSVAPALPARTVVSSKWTTAANVTNALIVVTTCATAAATAASILCTNPAETPAPTRSATSWTHRCTGTCCTTSR